MKRFAGFFLLMFLMLGTAPDASAQFWKKIFKKKEQTRPVRKKPAPAPAAAKKTEPKKSKEFEYPASKVKSRYRVDVLVPLYLDELVKNNKPVYRDRIPEKAIAGMNFYEGIKLASDTLRSYYNLDVYIHDVTTAGNSPEQLISSRRLDSSDLIIGALQAAQVKPVAAFARTRNVNFVSALSPSDAGIRENPYFTLLQPTLESHCEWIRKAVSRKYRNEKPVVLYRTTPSLDDNAYKYLVQDDARDYRTVLSNTMPTAASLRKNFDSTATNVVIIPIMDQEYTEKILELLSNGFPQYRFEVYGMPSLKSSSDLRKPGAYPNVAVSYTTPFYYDPSTASGQSLINRYRKDFGGRPGEMVYRGYEVLQWYAYLLSRYGTIFNHKLSDNGAAAFTRYEIRTRYDKNNDLLYSENQHLYLVRYQGGSFMVEQ